MIIQVNRFPLSVIRSAVQAVTLYHLALEYKFRGNYLQVAVYIFLKGTHCSEFQVFVNKFYIWHRKAKTLNFVPVNKHVHNL